MCGIAGALSATLSIQVRETVHNLLAHRGPDARGEADLDSVTLFHSRLSVIDLSSNANQPMVDSATGNVIIFNGEIFNYIELRGELQRQGCHFSTRSDTEVILKAFAHWGTKCFEKLNGMWALCIYDPRNGRLVLSRDRFGEKPLFMARSPYFCFGSEPKVVNALRGRQAKVQDSAVVDFLVNGKLYEETSSFYTDVEALPRGSFVEVGLSDSSLKATRFWSYGAENSGRRLDEILLDATAIRLRSDVPVGLTLSGGIDSSSLAVASKEAGVLVKCFTSTYEPGYQSEVEWARIASKGAGCELFESVFRYSDFANNIEKVAYQLDGPVYSTAVFPLWKLMSDVRAQGIKVVLDGQGADEVFGGYAQYAAMALHEVMRTRGIVAAVPLWMELTKTFPKVQLASWLARIAWPRAHTWYRHRVTLFDVLSEDVRKQFVPDQDSTHIYTGGLRAALIADHSTRVLPGLLHYGDAISMAHGVETRLPFLDFRIVDWALARQNVDSAPRTLTKAVLRDFLAAHGLQTVAQRKDKEGYPNPVMNWLFQNDAALLREYLLSPNSQLRYLCDDTRLRRFIAKAGKSGKLLWNHAFRLFSTETWLRTVR